MLFTISTSSASSSLKKCLFKRQAFIFSDIFKPRRSASEGYAHFFKRCVRTSFKFIVNTQVNATHVLHLVITNVITIIALQTCLEQVTKEVRKVVVRTVITVSFVPEGEVGVPETLKVDGHFAGILTV